jgi:hypothetical protein
VTFTAAGVSLLAPEDARGSCETRDVAGADRRGLGRVFDEAPDLYDRVRPIYPDAMFANRCDEFRGAPSSN